MTSLKKLSDKYFRQKARNNFHFKQHIENFHPDKNKCLIHAAIYVYTQKIGASSYILSSSQKIFTKKKTKVSPHIYNDMNKFQEMSKTK